MREAIAAGHELPGAVRIRLTLLRLVLVGYGAGHLSTAALFIGWPRYFVEGRGPRPVWPLYLFQFGAWPPTHVGFMNVLAVYDVAVAVALFLCAYDPIAHYGILAFAVVLWALHGGAHAYHIIFGSSPASYWSTVAELWLGAALLVALYPRQAFLVTDVVVEQENRPGASK